MPTNGAELTPSFMQLAYDCQDTMFKQLESMCGEMLYEMATLADKRAMTNRRLGAGLDALLRVRSGNR